MSGPQCCSNPPTLNPNAGAGHVEQLGGLNTYVFGSPNSKFAILLITDIFGIKVPIAILFSEFGDYSKPKLFKQLDDVLASKSDEVDGYVKIFPKVEHGWTVRYNVEDAAAVKSAEEAHQDLLEWFAKYVK